MYPDPTRDRRPLARDTTTSASRHWSLLSPLLSPFFDAAFLGHPSPPYFTYRRSRRDGSIIMQSRLDHVFAHSRYASWSFDTALQTYSESDHSGLLFSLTDSSSPPHTLHRLNTHYLSYPSLHTSTLPLLHPYHSPLYWDATKVIARSHAHDFAHLASTQRHSRLRLLERQLATAHRRSASDCSSLALAEEVLACRARLDAEVTDATSRSKLRARVHWLEEGETC